MDWEEWEEELSSLPYLGVKNKCFSWDESQGSVHGIKALGFRAKDPNKEADEIYPHKDGRSRRGVPSAFRDVDNSKRNSRKALRKRVKRLSIRYL